MNFGLVDLFLFVLRRFLLEIRVSEDLHPSFGQQTAAKVAQTRPDVFGVPVNQLSSAYSGIIDEVYTVNMAYW